VKSVARVVLGRVADLARGEVTLNDPINLTDVQGAIVGQVKVRFQLGGNGRTSDLTNDVEVGLGLLSIRRPDLPPPPIHVTDVDLVGVVRLARRRSTVRCPSIALRSYDGFQTVKRWRCRAGDLPKRLRAPARCIAVALVRRAARAPGRGPRPPARTEVRDGPPTRRRRVGARVSGTSRCNRLSVHPCLTGDRARRDVTTARVAESRLAAGGVIDISYWRKQG
jgi:hypothetical protein